MARNQSDSGKWLTAQEYPDEYPNLGDYQARFEKQVKTARHAIEYGSAIGASEAPVLHTAEFQMLWGAVFSVLHGVRQERPRLLDEIMHDSFLRYDMLHEFDQHLERLGIPKDIRIMFSEPGSGFCHDRKNNVIYLDIAEFLITGAHSVVNIHHENGHNLHSREYPAFMQDIWNEMADLHAKGGDMAFAAMMPENKKELPPPNTNGLSEAELKKLKLLHVTWQLSHCLWNGLEDNPMNAHAGSLHDLRQTPAQLFSKSDLMDSLHLTEVIRNQYGKEMELPTEATSEALLNNLSHASYTVMFVRNGLVPDTVEGWQKLGINPELCVDFSNKKKGIAAFQTFVEMTKQLCDMRPTARELQVGKTAMKRISPTNPEPNAPHTAPYTQRARISPCIIMRNGGGGRI